ncbi:MAG: PAS domain S-box protein, partial [Chloroflexi bacterium]
MEIQIILLVSLALQFIAAVLALRLAWQYRQQHAWVLITGAVSLMVLRRLFSLSHTMDGSHVDTFFWIAEIIGLALSVFLLWGIASIGPLLRTLRRTQDELEQHVAARTAELSRANAALQEEIAERENVAEALRASEARYRTVVNDQTDLICRYLPDGTLTFANEAYCQFYGHPLDKLIGLSIFQNMPEEDIDRVKRIIGRLDADNPVTVTEHHTTRDGRVSWRQWTHRAILDAQGQIVEIQATARDITRQRLMDEAMREREAQLRLMVQNLPVMVDALDENTVFVMWNREC